MNTERAARNLLVKYRDMRNEGVRPIDRKVNRASFQAACDTMWALGFGMTPSHVWDTVQTLVNASLPRTPYRADDNSAQQEYDAVQARLLGHALDAIKEA